MTRPFVSRCAARLAAASAAGLLLLLSGCFRHSPQWRYSAVPTTAASTTAASATMEAGVAAAERAAYEARDAAGVEAAIDAWEAVLGSSDRLDSRRRALVMLADLELLHGAAYADGCRAQTRRYRNAMGRGESALYTFPTVRARVDAGEPLWTAIDSLDLHDATAAEHEAALGAMARWFTALFYKYRDCMSSLGRVANLRWLQRARRVLDRAVELDPDWSDGVLRFSLAIYYLAVPEVAGGDRERSAAEFEKAMELDPDRLLFRWGRGRYFHLEQRDRAAFEADLRWVREQDLETVADPPRWAVYFQREAEDLQARADELF